MKLLIEAIIGLVIALTLHTWIAVLVARQSGHSSYGWAYFTIAGYLYNISSNTRKSV